MSDHGPVGVASGNGAGAPWDRATWMRAAIWIGVGVGIALRLRRWAADRSLWGDETLLALNLLGRSWTGLLAPLTHGQAAPIGFLWLEKLAVTCFGSGERALRLLPLLASVAALLLFRRIALKLLPPLAALFAIVFLALAEPHVYYAATFKQYAFDVFAVALLTERTLAIVLEPQSARRAWWLLAAAGCAAQLLSHAAVLAEVAVGGALLLHRWGVPSRPRWRLPVAVGATWVALFLVLYFAFLRDSFRNPYLRVFWAGSYAPLLPSSVADLRWYATRLYGYFSDPLGATPAALAAGLTLLGLVRGGAHRGGRLLLIGPLLVTLVASACGCYPFSTGLDADLGSGRFNWNGRLLLFTTPGVVVLSAGGLLWLGERFARAGQVAAAAVAVVLLAVPAFDSAHNFVWPPKLQEIGPAVAYMSERVEPGDLLFVRSVALPSYRYYARQFDLTLMPEPFDLNDAPARGELRRRVAELPVGQRLWIFTVDGLGENAELASFTIQSGLARVAVLRDSFEAERAHAWLFETDGGAAWRGGRGR